MAANRATNSKFRLCPYVGHKNKFSLGWHACYKMAANRATNTKFLFSGGFCPLFFQILESGVPNLSVAYPVRLTSSRLSTSFPASFFRMKRLSLTSNVTPTPLKLKNELCRDWPKWYHYYCRTFFFNEQEQSTSPFIWMSTSNTNEGCNFLRSWGFEWHAVVHSGDIQEYYSEEWITRIWWHASYPVNVLWTVYTHHEWEHWSVCK